MGTRASAITSPVETVHPDDVEAVERWAAAQTAQLRLLQREVLAARSVATSSPSPDAPGPSDGGAAVEELRPQLSAVVQANLTRLTAELEAARAEAASLLSEAVRQATDLLLAAGVDPIRIRCVTGSRTVPTGDAVGPAPAPPPDPVVLIRAPRAMPAGPLARPADGIDDGPPEVLDLTMAWPALEFDSAAHDEFWGDVMADRPVRARLRRWAQRQEQ
ncbi:MAG: hypothetical protein ACRDYW_03020 [Acidimicrobiales bacterium]